jgi:hypothetical protein
MRQDLQWGAQRSTGLVDVLDRVPDKGLVIAGDIKISLAEVELLTIRNRLIVCSIDKAEEVGLDWWKDISISRRASSRSWPRTTHSGSRFRSPSERWRSSPREASLQGKRK